MTTFDDSAFRRSTSFLCTFFLAVHWGSVVDHMARVRCRSSGSQLEF